MSFDNIRATGAGKYASLYLAKRTFQSFGDFLRLYHNKDVVLTLEAEAENG